MMVARNFILGSAVGLIAVSGAQAADLPVKAKAVQYVKICSPYGAGFWFIPGTDTCIKLGGYLRVDTTFNGGPHGQPAWNGDLGQQNRYLDYYASRSRMALTVDTRTASEYGVVRTFMQANFQFTTLANSTFNPAVIGAAGVSDSLLNVPGGGYVAVEYVFIQFAAVATIVQHGGHQTEKVIFYAAVGLRQRFNGVLLFDLVAQDADIVCSQFPLLRWHVRSLHRTPIGRAWEANAKSEVNFRCRMNTAVFAGGGDAGVVIHTSGKNRSWP
jgi:porin-like protein